MTDTATCRECLYQTFRPIPGQDRSIAWCGLHAISSDYARMQWFRDRSNTIPSEENCGPSGKFYQRRGQT